MEKSQLTESIRMALQFGYPCRENEERDKVKSLLSRLNSGEDPGGIKPEVEKLFPHIFKRERDLYPNCDPWDKMEDYWMEGGHNNALENEGELSGVQLDFCEVHKATIISHQNNLYNVEYEGKKQHVLDELISDLEIGDEVWIHRGFAVYK